MSFTQVAMVASLLIASAMGTCQIPSVTSYFTNIPKLGEDLTLLKWGHAINSKALLDEALKGDAPHMIESDLIHKGDEVYMGHSIDEIPDNFKFEDFLKHIIEQLKTTKNKTQKKGLKLDFKSTKAFELALEVLKKEKPNIKFPLWINADIVAGPNGKKAEVVLNFDKNKDELSCFVMSIGWTTGKWKLPADKVYTTEMIDAMIALKVEAAPKTYPVRAVYVAKSWTNLYEKLLKNQKDDTLTIWSPEDDIEDIDAVELNKVIEDNKSKIYVDLPKCIKDKLHNITTPCENIATTTTKVTEAPEPATTTEGGNGTNIVLPLHLLFLLSYTLASFV